METTEEFATVPTSELVVTTRPAQPLDSFIQWLTGGRFGVVETVTGHKNPGGLVLQQALGGGRQILVDDYCLKRTDGPHLVRRT